MKKLLNVITIAFTTAILASCCNMKDKGCDISERGKKCCHEKCADKKCPKCKDSKEGKIKCHGKDKE